MGIERAPSAIAGKQLANPVAALPSLHAAYPLLLCLFFWPVASRAWRVVLATYVVAMGFVLVYGAEHYVFDLLLGWVYAVAVTVAARALVRRRARHQGHVT
jgi:hypothetical protein